MKSNTINHLDMQVAHDTSIFVADGENFDPQSMAMVQAFYSRSTKSIADRVENMNRDQLRESLKKFYIGYGHRSIGQCGNFTIFIEDVSMFAAKCIQHNPLYNGQETSTRYYDFSTRPFVAPYAIDNIESELRGLYSAVLEHAIDRLSARATEMGEVLNASKVAAIKARAFDIARGFLSAGFTTKLSWTTNFDQVQEHLEWMATSPVDEVRALAFGIHKSLVAAYPDAIAANGLEGLSPIAGSFFDDTEEMAAQINCHYDPSRLRPDSMYCRREAMCEFDAHATDFLTHRQKYEKVPRNFAKYGTFSMAFPIDYGSYRDLHRHRNGFVAFPHYPDRPRIHNWYLGSLHFLGLMDKTHPALDGLSIGAAIDRLYNVTLPEVRATVMELAGYDSEQFHAAMMYYVPMATMVTAVMRYDLPQAIYVAELRSGVTVHPTARLAATTMGHTLRQHLPKEFPLYITDDADSGPNERRGAQTITENGKAID